MLYDPNVLPVLYIRVLGFLRDVWSALKSLVYGDVFRWTAKIHHRLELESDIIDLVPDELLKYGCIPIGTSVHVTVKLTRYGRRTVT